ncbi:hypothetical protein L207DRAFT_576502 [Hyaloscypha variabilis F]|uniref:C2H2-type domain-containing protein n=1 Tax=Hyaloscypha variabilis (strain UAMH 11265 / GT02V1 / F) TaxID=1149755 RepID=A0A2J6SAE4_HYAVF|nr:hypothetical protein L207DRAFT_576502 [Hyaloscypha variabilis F]
MAYDSHNHGSDGTIRSKFPPIPRPDCRDDTVLNLGFHHRASTAHRCETQSPDTSSGSKSKTNNTSQEDSKNRVGKRRRDDEDNRDQNAGGDGSPKRPIKFSSPPQNEDDNNKFACPYRKRDPRKYCIQHWRSCALTPLETIARVKGHLYRHHRIFPCQRCKQLFKDQDEVNSHLNEPKACEHTDAAHADGVTAEIVEKLRSKKIAQRTELERWQDIYKLLFPEEMIPSPYFEAVQEDIILSLDSRELAEYEEYCRRELPRDFSAALEEIVDNQSQPIEESIRNQLMTIIRDCQDRVFSRYRSSTSTVACTPSRNHERSSRSPPAASPEACDRSDTPLIANPISRNTIGRSSPSSFQPISSQLHLRSRLELPDMQDNVSKLPDTSDPSDSGYSSSKSAGLPSSFNSSSSSPYESSPQSQPQPQLHAPSSPILNDTQDTFGWQDWLNLY